MGPLITVNGVQVIAIKINFILLTFICSEFKLEIILFMSGVLFMESPLAVAEQQVKNNWKNINV